MYHKNPYRAEKRVIIYVSNVTSINSSQRMKMRRGKKERRMENKMNDPKNNII
jgi:hypothetical protein